MTQIIDEIFSEIRLHNFENALTLCNKKIYEDPGNSYAYELRGDCYSGVNNFQAALDSYNSSIDFVDTNLPEKDKIYSRLYTKTGSCNLKQKNVNDALSDLSKAINYDGTNPDAYLQRSKIYRGLKRYDEALSDAEQAVHFAPDNAAAYNSRGICFMYLSKAGEALLDFTAAINLKPDYAQAYHNRGNVYHRLLSDTQSASRDWDYANSLLEGKTSVKPKPKEEEIPDFSIGRIFNKNISYESGSEDAAAGQPQDEERELADEVSKIEIPEELKRLHFEIEGIACSNLKKPAAKPEYYVSDKPAQKLANIYLHESKGKPSVLKNLFILASLIVFIFLIIYGVYYSLVISRRPAETSVAKVQNENLINENNSDSTSMIISDALDSTLKAADMMLVRGDSGFYLQAGSFRDKVLADKKAKELEDLGFDVNVTDVQDSVKGILYKVRFGRYESLTEIDSVLKIYNNE